MTELDKDLCLFKTGWQFGFIEAVEQIKDAVMKYPISADSFEETMNAAIQAKEREIQKGVGK